MFFHGALGQAHGFGDVRVLATVYSIEQKDLPGAFGQGAQCRFDMAQIITGFERCLWFAAVAVRLVGLPTFVDAHPRAFTAQMVDGDIAGAAQQVGAEFLDL